MNDTEQRMYHKDYIDIHSCGNWWKTARLLPVHVVFFLQSLWVTSLGFPGSSVGKESACNAGDPGLIPGSERSTGEGIGYPLEYLGASLVTHMVKNPSGILC